MKSKLKELMAKDNKTQADIARATGLNRAIINRFYRGNVTRFNNKTVEILCLYFGLTKVDDLISLEGRYE